MNNNINRVHRILLPPSTPPPPSPPIFSFIAALIISMLIFMCIYVFSVIVSVAILLTLFITSMYLLRYINDRHETLGTDMRERNIFYGQIPQNNQRVVRFFDKLFWVVEERGGGDNRREGSNKKLIGSVVCFGSQEIMTSSSDCAICLEDFKEGEECLVFPICEHLFHLICIHHWLENKPSCPICRHCIPANMVTKTRSIEVLDNLV
ncbi:hypothetical protein Lal_00019139 [Lupinus albus]|uniref:RING-type E3 ubiquitin transferase n=1 Tax=Lupinus albus TaxID=3870 RepID=A0A6A4R3Y4_LUPAL|nr:putative transcription factor C2H2 family [Lupinus albus]KAF1899018.1 hypothetical protein Lal_00019139 [Lupinus albus]